MRFVRRSRCGAEHETRKRDGYATDCEHDPPRRDPGVRGRLGGHVLLRLGAVVRAGGGVRESAPGGAVRRSPWARARAGARGGGGRRRRRVRRRACLALPDRRRGRRRRERRGHGKKRKRRRPHWRLGEGDGVASAGGFRVRARLGVDVGSGFGFRVGFGNRGGRESRGDAPVYDRAVRRAGRRGGFNLRLRAGRLDPLPRARRLIRLRGERPGRARVRRWRRRRGGARLAGSAVPRAPAVEGGFRGARVLGIAGPRRPRGWVGGGFHPWDGTVREPVRSPLRGVPGFQGNAAVVLGDAR